MSAENLCKYRLVKMLNAVHSKATGTLCKDHIDVAADIHSF